MLRFHNTLSGQLEEFHPLTEGEVRFYYCGPTVWDYGHIGNFRSATATDILRRYLKFKGYKVTHVMNITDVEDRIIARAAERSTTESELARTYEADYWQQMSRLNVAPPDGWTSLPPMNRP